MNKKGKSSMWLIIALIAVAAYLFVPSVQSTVNGIFEKDAPAPGTSGQTADGGVCIYDGSTMTLGPVKKRYDPGTAAANIHDRVFINGVDRGLQADGATMSVTPGDEVEIVYAENASLYYAADQQFTVPCAKTFSSAESEIDPEGMHNIVLAGTSSTISMSVFNYADGLANDATTNNESVATSTSVTPKLRVTFPAKAGASPHGDQYLIVKFQSAAWDGQEFTVSSSDVELEKVDVPQIANDELSASGYSLQAYKFAGIESAATKVVNIFPSLTSDDSTAATNVTFVLYDEDYYQNSKTAKMEFGTENDADADVGVTTEPNVVYYVNTVGE